MNNRHNHKAGVTLLVLSIVFLTGIISGCGKSHSSDSASSVSYEFNVTDSPVTVASGDVPLMEEEAVFDSIPGMAGHHAATLTIFSDGEMLAAWCSYVGPHELTGLAIYRSRKKPGQSWESPQLHIDRSDGDGNPVLYSEGDRVWFFQAVVPGGWDTSHIEFQQSADRGVNWTDPVTLGSSLGPDVKYPPVRLNNGTLLLPAYDEITHKSVFYKSTNGTSWSELSTAASNPGNTEPSLVQLSTGRLINVMRNEGQGWLWVTASDDNGNSWAAPKDSGFLNPASATQIIRLANGHLVLIYNDSATERRPLSIALSADEGRTWPYRKVLKDGTDTYSYPFAVQAPDGVIHILYSLKRDKIMHLSVNEAWIIFESYIF
ncbi:MAG: hypothetical protein CVU55_14610 [Deltaproteobacteria bacterium HGW-Deltaproteobacteria-13]|jgi:predicted neuraminidase|nr:MAG: hypothetical protein CVU55_14610 [Deltaproteobacteria bacterium HGW-Deltaproteobacteria-13]